MTTKDAEESPHYRNWFLHGLPYLFTATVPTNSTSSPFTSSDHQTHQSHQQNTPRFLPSIFVIAKDYGMVRPAHPKQIWPGLWIFPCYATEQRCLKIWHANKPGAAASATNITTFRCFVIWEAQQPHQKAWSGLNDVLRFANNYVKVVWLWAHIHKTLLVFRGKGEEKKRSECKCNRNLNPHAKSKRGCQKSNERTNEMGTDYKLGLPQHS